MKKLILSFFILTVFAAYGQRSGHMRPNRFSYISAGGAYPYVGGQFGFEFDPLTYVQIQAFTDGGGIWKENKFNDWRTLSVVRYLPMKSIGSELRVGMGIVQTEERISTQKANSFGAAPQIGWMTKIRPNIGLQASFTYPISPASNLTPGILFSLECRMGRYVKENGLYSRKGRPIF
jgi:hypothetical protein